MTHTPIPSTRPLRLKSRWPVSLPALALAVATTLPALAAVPTDAPAVEDRTAGAIAPDSAPAARVPSPALQAALRDYAAQRLVSAARRFEQLARAGEPVAMHDLAVMHLRGEVAHPDLPRARELLEQAGRRGFISAQLALAELLESGRLGERDPAGALGWRRVAAELGSSEGQLAVGTAYYLGRGVERNEAEALRWYREAARGGDGGAQYLLASMYESGLGTEIDLRLARYWYDLASRQNDPAARIKRNAIDQRLADEAATN